MSRILVLGASGQVGGALARLLGPDAVAHDRESLDIADSGALCDAFEQAEPDAVINAAAYTRVDEAEDEEGMEEAFAVNAKAVIDLAWLCRERGVPLVHFSTDYVFNGQGGRPWTESDPADPPNAYGMSKLAGENGIAAIGGKHLIFRTSWVYDAAGRNFFSTMLWLGCEREEISVVSDQHGAPTYAPHLAEAALAGLKRAMAQPEFPSGIYHLCHGGETSWHGFAEKIFSLARPRDSALIVRRILPIATADYPTPAWRPANSRLDCAKARDVLNVSLPHWEEGLQACITEKYGNS